MARVVRPMRAITRSSLPASRRRPNRRAAAGVYMSTNQGQSWNLMAGGIGNPLIYDVIYRPERQPSHLTRITPTRAGEESSWLFPPRPTIIVGERDLRGLALRGRCHPDRRLRRLVHDQGLRRELDPDPIGQPALIPAEADYNEAIPVQPGAVNGDTPSRTRSPTIIMATSILP